MIRLLQLLAIVALAALYYWYIKAWQSFCQSAARFADDAGLPLKTEVVWALWAHLVGVTIIGVALALYIVKGQRFRRLGAWVRSSRTALRPGAEQDTRKRAGRWGGRIPALLVGAAACALTLGLYARSILGPVLVNDDFTLLRVSWTTEDMWANLWTREAGQIIPGDRLTTWLLIRSIGRPTNLMLALALHGPVFLLACMGLVYVFVRRELSQFYGGQLYALAAMSFFGVSTVYHEAVWRFTASFMLLSTAVTLLALLAAQRWQQTGRVRHLVLCVVWCACAPLWFAIGVLAGPLCCLYLVAPQRPGASDRSGGITRRTLVVGAPLLGSVPAILASALESPKDTGAFQPLAGLAWTGRAIIDSTALGITGVTSVSPLALPWPIALAALVVLAGAAVWWWRFAPAKTLLLVGLGAVVLGYWIPYSARAPFFGPYENMTQAGWSRYHLLPHLGLTLFLTGGLPHWSERLGLSDNSSLTWQQMRWLLVPMALVFLLQLGRPIVTLSVATLGRGDKQMATLRRIEEVNTVCRARRISAITARQAFGTQLDIVGFDDPEDAWKFLRGSDYPLPWTVEEARYWLEFDTNR